VPAIIPNSSILLSNFLRSNSDISLLWCILRGIRDGRIRDPNSRFLGAKKRRQLIAGRCSPSHSRARVPPVECTHPRAEIEIERFLGRIGSVRVLRALLSTGKSEIFCRRRWGRRPVCTTELVPKIRRRFRKILEKPFILLAIENVIIGVIVKEQIKTRTK